MVGDIYIYIYQMARKNPTVRCSAGPFMAKTGQQRHPINHGQLAAGPPAPRISQLLHRWRLAAECLPLCPLCAGVAYYQGSGQLGVLKKPMSHEENTVIDWLGVIYMDILPNYRGMMISHSRGTYQPASIMRWDRIFEMAHVL